MGMDQYKWFLIDGSAAPTFATGFDWYAQGIILRPARLGSIIEVRRIEGPIEMAEAHGLKLCKPWIDKRPNVGVNLNNRVYLSSVLPSVPKLPVLPLAPG